MNSTELIKRHTENKKFLQEADIYLGHHRIKIIDRFKDNILLQYRREESFKTTMYRYIRVKDSSTGKYVFLSVPNTIDRCKKAVAWTFGLSPQEYDLIFET